MTKAEAVIGYEFSNKELMITALTHGSYLNTHQGQSYERLEFLGDALLDMLVAERLLLQYPTYPEGRLSKMRAGMVCEQALCRFANRVGITELILHDKSVSLAPLSSSIAADVVEAIVAAIYLDGGFETAKAWVEKNITEKDAFIDYKTTLQEVLAKSGEKPPVYQDVGAEGPAHDRVFLMSVSIDGVVMGKGRGKTKKEAEQEAAMYALKHLGH